MDNGAAIKRGQERDAATDFWEITLEIDIYAIEKANTGRTWGFLRQVPRLCFTHVERVANLSLDDHYREDRFE